MARLICTRVFNRPYKVTAYKPSTVPTFTVGDYHFYWEANLVSWVWHHILGYHCNTWKKDEE